MKAIAFIRKYWAWFLIIPVVLGAIAYVAWRLSVSRQRLRLAQDRAESEARYSDAISALGDKDAAMREKFEKERAVKRKEIDDAIEVLDEGAKLTGRAFADYFGLQYVGPEEKEDEQPTSPD